jgi:hypothetical protein
VPAGVSSKQLTRSASRCALAYLCFHFDILLSHTLDMAVRHNHGAVGGFFSAPHERAAYTSFEGGGKCGKEGGDLL